MAGESIRTALDLELAEGEVVANRVIDESGSNACDLTLVPGLPIANLPSVLLPCRRLHPLYCRRSIEVTKCLKPTANRSPRDFLLFSARAARDSMPSAAFSPSLRPNRSGRSQRAICQTVPQVQRSSYTSTDKDGGAPAPETDFILQRPRVAPRALAKPYRERLRRPGYRTPPDPISGARRAQQVRSGAPYM